MQAGSINVSMIPQFYPSLDEECRYQSPRRVSMNQNHALLTPKGRVQHHHLGLSPLSTTFTTSRSTKNKVIHGSPCSATYDNSLTKSAHILRPKLSQVPVVRETIYMQNKIGEEQNQKYINSLLSELESSKLKCTQLEVHLSKITAELDNLKQTQSKIDMLLSDNDRVNDILEDKIKEANLWKQKYEIEVATNQQEYFYKEESNSISECLKKKQDEIDQLNIQIYNIQQENQHLYLTIQSKDEIINQFSQNYNDNKRMEGEVIKKSQIIWKRKEGEFVDEINEYSIQVKMAVEERDKWKFKFIDSEKQRGEYRIQAESSMQELQLLKQENDRFNTALKGKHSDIEKLQSNLFANQQQLEEMKNKIQELQFLQSNLEQKSKDCEEMRTKNVSYIAQYEQLKKIVQENEESLKDQSLTIQENNKLKQKVNNQEKQLNEQNIIIKDLNQNLNYLKSIEQDKQNLDIEYKNIKIDIQKSQEQIAVLEKELKTSQNDNKLLTEQLFLMQSLETENIRLKDTLNSNQIQTEEYLTKVQNLQHEIDIEKSEKKNFKNQIVHLNERIHQKDMIIEEQKKLIDKIDSEMSKNEQMTEEVLQFNKLLDQKTRDLESIKLKNQNMKEQMLIKNEQVQQARSEQLIQLKEIERLTNCLGMKNNQIEIFKIQIQELETKSSELQCDKYDRTDQMQLFSTEIDRLNGSLAKRMKEIELLRQKSILTKGFDHILPSQGFPSILSPQGLDSIDFKMYSKGSIYQEKQQTQQPQQIQQKEQQQQKQKGQQQKEQQRIQDIQFEKIQNETVIENLQAQNEQLLKQYEQVEKEIERKDSLIAHKQKEYELLKQKLNEANQKCENIYVLEDQNKVLEIEICNLQKEKESLIQENNQIRYKYTEFSQLTFKVQDLQYQLVLARIVLESQANELKNLRR